MWRVPENAPASSVSKEVLQSPHDLVRSVPNRLSSPLSHHQTVLKLLIVYVENLTDLMIVKANEYVTVETFIRLRKEDIIHSLGPLKTVFSDDVFRVPAK